MANKRVSPNRMELMRLKRQLITACKGHAMLKDKRDGLMKNFLALVDDTLAMRHEMEHLLAQASSAMGLARATMGPKQLQEASLQNASSLEFKVSVKKIMAVETPSFKPLTAIKTSTVGQSFPYSLATSTSELDDAVDKLAAVLPTMVKLAEKEKSLELMAAEIERTRRRVNSLEHVMIPELQAMIKEIQSKLSESELANQTRLMKVKDMIVAAEMKQRQAYLMEQAEKQA